MSMSRPVSWGEAAGQWGRGALGCLRRTVGRVQKNIQNPERREGGEFSQPISPDVVVFITNNHPLKIRSGSFQTSQPSKINPPSMVHVQAWIHPSQQDGNGPLAATL